MASSSLPKELEDAFIKISFKDERVLASSEHDPTYGPWVENASAQRTETNVWATATLRKLYPGHSVTSTVAYSTNVLALPQAIVQPINPDEMVTSTFFYPLARRSSVPGVLAEYVRFGSFRVAWESYDFIVYATEIYAPYATPVHFIVHDGPEQPSRHLLMAAGLWAAELHDEILVFDQGFWNKSAALWEEIQKADWKDVILEKERKDSMHKDIYGFFKSEHVYRELAIPWKRGIIMYGPPGNGKTISIKAIMKECNDKGFSPLYVKSFQSWFGEEASMQMVFGKAREMAPCVLILEDLDALINDRNRSYFLNQLDGFEANDGIIVIGTTNHFERLDPAISTRPSRFDRKYLFDDPTEDERILYAQYWQKKLSSNDTIDFPDSLVKDVARKTEKFSFAYLKEAFVSSLFLLATNDDDKDRPFRDVLISTIKKLSDDLKKTPHDEQLWARSRALAAGSSQGSAIQRPFIASSIPRFGEGPGVRPEPFRPDVEGPVGQDGRPQYVNGRDVRSLAQAAAKLGRSYIF